ncbi:eukaryotic translation initiation factor 3 subunit J [Coccinella septempunctata]|uniref:eukaryotic translation initiation factor 3 subunit J n=1 Tax=Coccinella septempunctata TaxID=41139 RepID=UPI001D099CDE|nr:eukaryotic translation initiation factor 3 subunit J [Coccinella septempunctata]
MESWDDDNFEPPVIAPENPVVNKWAGEDEEEEIKDNWEDEDEDKKEEEIKVVEPVKKSKKKILSEKIAEKERMKKDDDKRIKEYEDEEEISPEERLRRQKESDLKLALETTFSTGDSLGDLPTSKDEIQEFGDNLCKKLLSMSKNAEFVNFAESLVRNLCAGLPSHDIRKIKNSLDNLYLEKQKIEKGDKAKKNKGKGKVKLKVDDPNPLSAYVNDYDDFNDFM